MLAHWETNAGFRHQRLTNRANRALARSSKYTGGSTTFMKMKVRLSKSLEREATLTETFKFTHTLKENKARFVDQRSQDHYRLKATTQQSQQNGEDAADGFLTSVVDSDVVCHETTSSPYKNRVYGLGSFFTSSLRTSTLSPPSGSAISRAIHPEEGMDLRLQEQELQRSLHQQAQEFNDYQEKYQEILTRMTSTNEFRLEFRESLEQMQRMEAQMEVYQAQMRTAGIDPAGGSTAVLLKVVAVALVAHKHRHRLLHRRLRATGLTTTMSTTWICRY
ncbi:hypothetical protein Ahy_B08g092303 [Arachis hypogaea]|uniref:Uncharacterized protein n=1 Tax=Arachis hypogaea TaxID=3818 RepID=A0A444Y3Q4_ARAHY|nr:hypothetical protein Ahy_B08g092303 [Arachis hypogaea]